MKYTSISACVTAAAIGLTYLSLAPATAQPLSPSEQAELRRKVERSIEGTKGSDTEKYRAGQQAMEKFYGDRAGSTSNAGPASTPSTSSTVGDRWRAGMAREEGRSANAEGLISGRAGSSLGLLVLLGTCGLLGFAVGRPVSHMVNDERPWNESNIGVAIFVAALFAFIGVPTAIWLTTGLIGLFIPALPISAVSPWNFNFSLPAAAGAATAVILLARRRRSKLKNSSSSALAVEATPGATRGRVPYQRPTNELAVRIEAAIKAGTLAKLIDEIAEDFRREFTPLTTAEQILERFQHAHQGQEAADHCKKYGTAWVALYLSGVYSELAWAHMFGGKRTSVLDVRNIERLLDQAAFHSNQERPTWARLSLYEYSWPRRDDAAERYLKTSLKAYEKNFEIAFASIDPARLEETVRRAINFDSPNAIRALFDPFFLSSGDESIFGDRVIRLLVAHRTEFPRLHMLREERLAKIAEARADRVKTLSKRIADGHATELDHASYASLLEGPVDKLKHLAIAAKISALKFEPRGTEFLSTAYVTRLKAAFAELSSRDRVTLLADAALDAGDFEALCQMLAQRAKLKRTLRKCAKEANFSSTIASAILGSAKLVPCAHCGETIGSAFTKCPYCQAEAKSA